MYGIYTNSSHEKSTKCRYTIHGSYGFVAKESSIVFSSFKPQQLETKFPNLKFGKFGLWYKKSQQRIVPMSHPMICKWLIAMVSFRPLKDRVVGPPVQMAELLGLFFRMIRSPRTLRPKPNKPKHEFSPDGCCPKLRKQTHTFLFRGFFSKDTHNEKTAKLLFLGSLFCFFKFCGSFFLG